MLSSSKLSRVLTIQLGRNSSLSCIQTSSNQSLVMSNHSMLVRRVHQDISTEKQISEDERARANFLGTKQSQDKGFMTIPNLLTCSRILLTPAIGYYIWNELHSHALLCFSFAAVTDLLDGLIARKFNQGSRVGAILDPIADKFLLTTCFVALHQAQLMPLWLVGTFIGRDLGLLIGGALLRYQSFSERPPSAKQFFNFTKYPATPEFEPTFVSKCNTALQCLLIVTHLTTYNHTGHPTYDMSISALRALTASTTIFSMSQYAFRAFRSGQQVKRKIK